MGWRKVKDITIPLGSLLPKHGIEYLPENGERIEFPSVWTNIHTYRRFKATRRGLRASMSPGSTLSPHNLSERLANVLRVYFFGGFLSFPTWDKNKYSTPHPVVKGKKLDVCLYKTTRSDTGFKDLFAERSIKWIANVKITKVEPDKVIYEDLNGNTYEAPCKLSMLMPRFMGSRGGCFCRR